MPFTYVIPDLHGRRDLLDAALAEIFARAGGGTIVALGDYVDKGPDSRGVIARMREGVAPPWRLIALKGNHDAMMVAALRGDPGAMEFWLARGGDAALASYGGDAAGVPAGDVAWLDACVLMHVDTHRIYVHAGVDPALALGAQDETTLTTKRYVDDAAAGFGGRFVVHGHDNKPEGPILRAGRINLDTAAWKTGRIVIGVFDDTVAGGPAELIEVIGAAR